MLLLIATEISNRLPLPKSNTRLTGITTMMEMKEKNQIKKNIRAASVMKAKVGEMEEKTREGRNRTTGKDVVVCIQVLF